MRLSGQDSQRGTFFHRHAVLHNQNERGTHTPLQHLFEGQPRFRVINSLLPKKPSWVSSMASIPRSPNRW